MTEEPDLKRAMQIESLKHDLSKAKTVREWAWEAIQNGADPAYVAMRYALPLETMKEAKKEHLRREELKKRGDA